MEILQTVSQKQSSKDDYAYFNLLYEIRDQVTDKLPTIHQILATSNPLHVTSNTVDIDIQRAAEMLLVEQLFDNRIHFPLPAGIQVDQALRETIRQEWIKINNEANEIMLRKRLAEGYYDAFAWTKMQSLKDKDLGFTFDLFKKVKDILPDIVSVAAIQQASSEHLRGTISRHIRSEVGVRIRKKCFTSRNPLNKAPQQVLDNFKVF